MVAKHFLSGIMAYVATVIYTDHVEYDVNNDPDITDYEVRTMGSLQIMHGASGLAAAVFVTHGFALFLVADSAYQPIPNSPVN